MMMNSYHPHVVVLSKGNKIYSRTHMLIYTINTLQLIIINNVALLGSVIERQREGGEDDAPEKESGQEATRQRKIYNVLLSFT